MEIRPVQRHELPLLLDLAIETFEDTFAPHNSRAIMDAFIQDAYTLEKFEAEWSEADAANYMMWDDGVPIAFMRLRLSNEVSHILGNNTIELQRLYVRPQSKGKGAGTALMKEAIRYSKSCHHEWIWLGVWERNFPAQRFYASWGYEKFSEHVFMMGDDAQIDWLLKKSIL